MMIRLLIILVILFQFGFTTEIDTDKVRVSKWNDGSFFEMIWPFPEQLKFKNGVHTKENSKLAVRVYQLSVDSNFKNGGIEYEIILKKKPPTNSISIAVNSNRYVFYYQPALTQDEINEGLFRPDNVVGSYAVYHATGWGNEYKSGKAFHIYRPYATDNSGWSTWLDYNTDLNDTGILIITIDQKYLDNADYPITIDPSIGDESGGASCDEGWDLTAMNAAAVGSTQCFESVSAQIDKDDSGTCTGNCSFQGALWDDSSTYPVNRKAVGADVDLVGDSGTPCNDPAYVTSTFAVPVELSSQILWLGGAQDGTTNSSEMTYDSVAGITAKEISGVNTAPDPFPAGATNRANRQYSIYATYNTCSAEARRIMLIT